MEQKNFIELIYRIIDERTKFLRTFSGKVMDVNDTEQKGRILCQIPELGWTTNESGAWCYPTQDNSLITPKIGDWVRVGFLAGKPERPYYMGIMSEIEAMNPTNYDGASNSQVIYESNDNTTYVKHDENAKTFSIVDSNGNEIQMGITATDLINTLLHLGSATASEPFMLGNVVDAWFTAIIAVFNGHTHDGVTVGGASTGTPSATFTPPVNHLSNKIFGE